jgi:hypothetical protein
MRITVFSLLLASFALACSQPEPGKSGDLARQAATRDAAAAPAPAAPATTAGSGAAAGTAGAAPETWREITIPAGTQLAVSLDAAVGSAISHVEEPVAAHLTRPIRVDGDAVVLEGALVTGVVTAATPSAKVKGRAHVAVRFDSLTPRGDDQHYAIRTASVERTAAGTKKKDAVKIGAPAAGGAIVGALLGGKKGALIGTAVGGGAGTAVVLSTSGPEVSLPKGAALTLKLAAPVTVRVRG